MLDKVMRLRRKVVAHSDEEEMHFLSTSFQVFDDHDVRIPQLQFNESLELTETEVRKIESLLHKLTAGVGKAIFQVAQQEPERLKERKIAARLAM